MAAIQKDFDKIKRTFDSGSSYEAKEACKALFYRKRTRKAIEESYALAQAGAKLHLQHGQINEGVELALLFLEAMGADAAAVSQEHLSLVLGLADAFPNLSQGGDAAGEEVAPRVEELARLVSAAAKWAYKQDGGVEAFRRVHDGFAAYLWRCYGSSQLGRAAAHWARGSDVPAFADALRVCSSSALPAEQDLFVARAVLQTLAVASRATVAEQYSRAQALLTALQALSCVPDSPLSHAVGFLLHAVQARSHPLWAALMAQYAPSFGRDPSFAPLLRRIEETFYNVQRDSGLGGLLGGLLGGM